MQINFNKIFSLLLNWNLGQKSKIFLKNIGCLTIATIIASVIGLPIKILIGRFLGPEEFGKFALILNLTQFFIIPMIFGLTVTSQRYLSSHPEHKQSLVGFISILSFITISTSTVILISSKNLWVEIFGIPSDLFWWAIVFSATTALYYIYDSIIKGLHYFKAVAYTTIIAPLITLPSFAFMLFILDIHTYQSFTLANIIQLGIIFIIFALIVFKDHIHYKPPPEINKSLIKYTGIAIVGSIAGTIVYNTDRFFLNHFVSLYWVGIYAAYTNGSEFIVGRFLNIVTQIYFPTISGEKNKAHLVNKLKKIINIIVVPIFIISLLSIWIVLLLFGNKFPILLNLIILFSINNCLLISHQLYMWLLNSQGNLGAKTVLKFSVINAIINLILMYFLVQTLGVNGAITATIIVNFLFLIYFSYQAKQFVKKQIFT